MSQEVFTPHINEIEQNPTLIDHYAERVVTFRGVTAPLGVLINLCPVSKEAMDPEKINEWTENILEASGIDYKAELSQIESAKTDSAKKKLKK
ncbi:hypothetical protein H0V99_01670 [Candidatus Saccharibacteria bacterium]|nr:hypothetical protein [Candidatus Saccharibacteria bacterium]